MTPTQRRVTVIALVAIPVLVLGLVVSLLEPSGHEVEAGEQVELTDAVHAGATHEVRLPSSTLAMQVGDPVDEVDDAAADISAPGGGSVDGPVRPPDGHRLLPVTWSLRGGPVNSEAEESGSIPADEDSTLIDITLVVDGEGTALVAARPVHSITDNGQTAVLIPVDDGVEVGDVTVEVTYDDLTQTLSPESGKVDSGAAAPLYEGHPRALPTGCPAGTCRFEPTDPEAPLRLGRDRTGFSADDVHLRPYDPDLGWAEDGEVWASVMLNSDGVGSFIDDEGNLHTSRSAPSTKATLGSTEAERIEQSEEANTIGRAVFAVDPKASPRTLTVEQAHKVDHDGTSTKVTLRGEVEVDERD
ncbi:MAG TPA: hypothetical protein H9805_14945 [Candidatus Janibacter merdipullorum]|nr:hypothetical protein [Candidatus Janibacter merdipullorum]